MKTTKKLMLAAILTMPAITNAVLFTEQEITSSKHDDVRDKVGVMMLTAYVNGLNNTPEYQELVTVCGNLGSNLKVAMITANKVQNLIEQAAEASTFKVSYYIKNIFN
jgi:hypothetical protein